MTDAQFKHLIGSLPINEDKTVQYTAFLDSYNETIIRVGIYGYKVNIYRCKNMYLCISGYVFMDIRVCNYGYKLCLWI